MLVDGDYNIVGLADWEFTYTAPQEYQCCMASWLILSRPYDWIPEDCENYSKQLRLFLEVLEEEESSHPMALSHALSKNSLSSVIRDGWSSGAFWFILCARNTLYFNELWARFEAHSHP